MPVPCGVILQIVAAPVKPRHGSHAAVPEVRTRGPGFATGDRADFTHERVPVDVDVVHRHIPEWRFAGESWGPPSAAVRSDLRAKASWARSGSS